MKTRRDVSMLYSVIIPCYKSSRTIRGVVEETMQKFEEMNRGQVEFVLVDDCSPDEGATVTELRHLVEEYPCVRVVELAKNSGQHNEDPLHSLKHSESHAFVFNIGQLKNVSQDINGADRLQIGYDEVFDYLVDRRQHSAGCKRDKRHIISPISINRCNHHHTDLR